MGTVARHCQTHVLCTDACAMLRSIPEGLGAALAQYGLHLGWLYADTTETGRLTPAVLQRIPMAPDASDALCRTLRDTVRSSAGVITGDAGNHPPEQT